MANHVRGSYDPLGEVDPNFIADLNFDPPKLPANIRLLTATRDGGGLLYTEDATSQIFIRLKQMGAAMSIFAFRRTATLPLRGMIRLRGKTMTRVSSLPGNSPSIRTITNPSSSACARTARSIPSLKGQRESFSAWRSSGSRTGRFCSEHSVASADG
jgi:hypothetical protein